MLSRYQASMVLAGVGDAIGYKQGSWEFCKNGEAIHKDVARMGGVEKIQVQLPYFPVSDDTVMLIAVAEGLVKAGCNGDKETLYSALGAAFQDAMMDMDDRAVGFTTSYSVSLLQPQKQNGYQIPFNKSGVTCGAAMRSMCIGLRYPRPEDLEDLIVVSVESGRMTHHNPTGYLGALVSALFTSYAVQGRPLKEWGAALLPVLNQAKQYIQSTGRYVKENMDAWGYFEASWRKYLTFRGISDGQSEPKFNEDDEDVRKRDALYNSWSYSGWGGAHGHDAPMIAYDALMRSGTSWKELCMRAMFHGGDNDSTGVIAGAWFGALYGLQGVPASNHMSLEYKEHLLDLADKLYNLASPT